MSAVVLVFALNLFGVFEISLPQSANRGLLGWTATGRRRRLVFPGRLRDRSGHAMHRAVSWDRARVRLHPIGLDILLMFVAIAAGMSAPYLLLRAQPAWLRFLPQARARGWCA